MALFDFVGDIFEEKRERQPDPEQLKIEEPEFVKGARGRIEEFAKGGGRFGSQIESLMSQFLSAGGMPPLFGEATDFLSKSLGGDFQNVLREFEPFSRLATGELGKAQSRLRRRAQLGGHDPSSTRLLGEEGELETSFLDTMMTKLAQLFNQERGRQFAAVPGALGAAETERFLPARVAATGQAFEEAPLEASFKLMESFEPTFFQPQFRTIQSPFETGLGFAKDITSIGADIAGIFNPLKAK